jgi:putative membrane protein
VKFILRWFVNAVALYVAALIVHGIQMERDWGALAIIALIFGVVNALIRPVLNVLSCPLIALSLGLFTLVINAAMLLLTSWIAGLLGIGFVVNNFAAALVGALVISVVSILLNMFVRAESL